MDTLITNRFPEEVETLMSWILNLGAFVGDARSGLAANVGKTTENNHPNNKLYLSQA